MTSSALFFNLSIEGHQWFFEKRFMKKKVPQVMVQNIQRWPIEKLIPYARNTRTHSDAQVAEVASSIAEFGFVHPVLAAPDGVIVAGHCRVLAARKLGLAEVPVVVLEHLSEVQRQALAIADNRLALNAGWDEEMLRVELSALQEQEFSFDLLGFDDEELHRLLAETDPTPELQDPDAVPAPPRVAVSRAGDLWQCGEHRVLSGDATAWPDVERLMGGEEADLVFTDLAAEELLAGNPNSAGSPGESLQEHLVTVLSHYRRLVKPTASLYICHPPAWQRELQNALESAGFTVAGQIVWARQSPAQGSGHYKLQHELIFHAHVSGQKDVWYGDKRQSTLWTQDQPAHSQGKPVELVERALRNSSQKGGLVTDLSASSGSTLIACERLGRRARVMGRDPRCVDAAVMRWQKYTGQTPVLPDLCTELP
jgi:DNA modification methylase